MQAIWKLTSWGMLTGITGVAMEGKLQPCYHCAVQMATVLVKDLALNVRYCFPKVRLSTKTLPLHCTRITPHMRVAQTVPLHAHNAAIMPASGTTATAYVPGGKTPGEVQHEMQRVLALFQQVVDELDQEHTAAPAPAAVASSYAFRPTTTTTCVDYNESSTCPGKTLLANYNLNFVMQGAMPYVALACPSTKKQCSSICIDGYICTM